MSNQVPDGWQLRTVGDLCVVKRGASPRPIQDPKWWGGNVSWVRISDVTASNKYLKKTTQYLSDEGVNKSVNIPKGEVVLSICATIGRPIIINIDACIHDGFVWFSKLDKTIEREYWYYFLLSKEAFFASQRQSGTQGNLNTSIVSDLLCSLPPVKEQQKIAAILTSVDDVIEKTQAQINKLKDLKTGMMQELLTQGVGVNGKPHTEFKDSPVGCIPKGWDCVLLESLLITDKNSMRSGPFGSALLKHELVKKGHPYLGIDNVHVERFENKFKRFVSDEKFEQLKKFAVKEDDVMITIMGTVGRSCLVPKGVGKALSSKHVWTMTFDLSKYIPSLICWQLNYSDWVKKQFRNEAQGGVMESISSKTLKGLWLPLPPLSDQVKIAETHEKLSKKIESKENILNKYQLMKKALMQDLLTGKVRVNVD